MGVMGRAWMIINLVIDHKHNSMAGTFLATRPFVYIWGRSWTQTERGTELHLHMLYMRYSYKRVQ